MHDIQRNKNSRLRVLALWAWLVGLEWAWPAAELAAHWLAQHLGYLLKKNLNQCSKFAAARNGYKVSTVDTH